MIEMINNCHNCITKAVSQNFIEKRFTKIKKSSISAKVFEYLLIGLNLNNIHIGSDQQRKSTHQNIGVI